MTLRKFCVGITAIGLAMGLGCDIYRHRLARGDFFLKKNYPNLEVAARDHLTYRNELRKYYTAKGVSRSGYVFGILTGLGVAVSSRLEKRKKRRQP
jgi:hypothetical protein